MFQGLKDEEGCWRENTFTTLSLMNRVHFFYSTIPMIYTICKCAIQISVYAKYK